ncbi:MAG: transposase [Candidatus Babeliales bacterium]|jgi:SRSO17 transposase
MHAVQSYQKTNTPQYVEALLLCPEKKVCTNLSDTINRSHDSVQRELACAAAKQEDATQSLRTLALNELNADETDLIHDDTQLTKLYSKLIEGLDVGFDGSLGRAALGLKVVTSLLTDRHINIPIEAIPFVSKELAQASYRTKSDIAIEVTKQVIKHFRIKRVLADAHFATKCMLTFLNNEQINYLMKIPRSRVVAIDGIEGQLKNVLRLKKNNRVKMAKGTFKEIECYFYVIKIYNGATIYLVSNDLIDPYEVVELYRIRWNIELFHRTAKQYLGLGDCQMRSIEKQRQHILYVMHAYALASVQMSLMNLACVEDVINHLRNVKPNYLDTWKSAAKGNFDYVA